MATYATVVGFIQFDPNERDANGQTVRDVVVQAVGSGGKNVRLTVWPEHGGTPLAKGDFVAAQGKFSQANVNGKEYLNLSVNDLVVIPGAPKRERGVENPVEDDDKAPF